MEDQRRVTTNPFERPVDEALRRARADAASFARRERVLFAVAASVLGIVALRGLLGIAAALATDGAPVVPLALTFSMLACLGALWLAHRARTRFDDVAAKVRLLELARDAADHPLAPVVALHPYRSEERGGPVVVLGAAVTSAIGGAAERTSLSSWARRSAAAAACVAAIGLLGFAAAPASASKLRWMFLGPTAAPAVLGLRAHVEGSGTWQVEDDVHATGARALVNRPGDPSGPPALIVSTASWTRDLRAVTRCKVAPDLAARACGVVFRFRDAANYHAARLDAERGTLVVAMVSGGREEILGEQAAPAAPGVWQELAVEARAGRIRLTWNSSTSLEVIDPSPVFPGGVGLWAPAAGAASFDELTVDQLPASAQALELLPLLGRGRS